MTVYSLSLFGLCTILAFIPSYFGNKDEGSLIVTSGTSVFMLSWFLSKVTFFELLPPLDNVFSSSSSGFSFEFLVLDFLRLPFKKVEFEEVECILDN